MFDSILAAGKALAQKVFPIYTSDIPDNRDDLIGPQEFLDAYRELDRLGTGPYEELEKTLNTVTVDWFKSLLLLSDAAHSTLLELLSASSDSGQTLLGSLLRNGRFFDTIVALSYQMQDHLALCLTHSARVRHNCYILLASLGMHSWDGYVLVFDTVNFLECGEQRALMSLVEEDLRGNKSVFDALAPLALLLVLVAGANGFLTANQMRHRIQKSDVLVILMDLVRSARLTNATSGNETNQLDIKIVRPKIKEALEILGEAEKSSDRILQWFDSKSPADSRRESQALPSVNQNAESSVTSPVVSGTPTKDEQKLPQIPAPPSETKDVSVPQETQRPVAEVRPLPPGEGVPPPAPPPPPPPATSGKEGLSLQKSRPAFKPLRWSKIEISDVARKNTIWEPNGNAIPLSIEKLEEFFKIRPLKHKASLMNERVADAAGLPEPHRRDSLSTHLELRLNVLLKQFSDESLEELVERIVNMEYRHFDDSQLKELITALPTEQEIEDICHIDPKLVTKPAEKFVALLKDVEHPETRLKVMLLMTEFPTVEESVKQYCDDIISACRTIQKSASFRTFVQTVLQVGNKMNHARLIGGARAFHSTILAKLPEITGYHNYSLLHLVIDEASTKAPESLEFVDEFEKLLHVPRVPLSQIQMELTKLQHSLNHARDELQDCPREVRKKADKLLVTLPRRISNLSASLDAARQQTRNLARYLVEDPATFQLSDYLEILAVLVKSIQNIKQYGSEKHTQSHPKPYEFINHSGGVNHRIPILGNAETASVFESFRERLNTM